MDFIAFYLKKLFGENNVLMGIRNKDGLFIALPSLFLDPSGNLYYLDVKNRRKSISSLIYNILKPNIKKKYWFESLYFIDKNTDYNGFITLQAPDAEYDIDYDDFVFKTTQPGFVSVIVDNIDNSLFPFGVSILDHPNKNYIFDQVYQNLKTRKEHYLCRVLQEMVREARTALICALPCSDLPRALRRPPARSRDHSP
jgi:hypothetical protein